MEMEKAKDPMESFFERLGKLGQSQGEYPAHPSEEILRAYLLKSLPRGVRRSPEVLAGLARGELEEWRQAEVGLHVKTCTRCSEAVAQLRLEAAEEKPSLLERIISLFSNARQTVPRLAGAVRTRGATVGKGRLKRPGARWAWAASLVVVLGLGIALGFFLRPTQLVTRPMEIGKAQVDQVFGQVRSGTASPDPLVALRLGRLLQAAGMDLTRFDLDNPFEYAVQPGDTLKGIAQQFYGDERFWVVVYILNYNYDDLQVVLQEALETQKDPGEVELPKGLSLVLVEKKP